MPQRDASDALPLTLGEEPRFCPACGLPVEARLLEEDHRPRLVCPEGHVTWRNPRVVVGTLPIEDGRVYLARRAIEPVAWPMGQPERLPRAGRGGPGGSDGARPRRRPSCGSRWGGWWGSTRALTPAS